eukprot:2475710-Alexandrium_andersonii.AAC.1
MLRLSFRSTLSTTCPWRERMSCDQCTEVRADSDTCIPCLLQQRERTHRGHHAGRTWKHRRSAFGRSRHWAHHAQRAGLVLQNDPRRDLPGHER